MKSPTNKSDIDKLNFQWDRRKKPRSNDHPPDIIPSIFEYIEFIEELNTLGSIKQKKIVVYDNPFTLPS